MTDGTSANRRFAVVTDSTADITPQMAKERGISVIPLCVTFGQDTLLDGANSSWAEKLEVVNIFKYWRPAELIEKGTMPTEAWFVLGGVAVVTLVASVFVFARRDVT